MCVHLVLTGLAMLTLPACAPQLELGERWSDLPARAASTYPEILTTGDILEIRYFFEAHIDDAPYRLGIGDLVTVAVREYPDLSAEELVIRPDGTVSLPVVGNLIVAGRSVQDVTGDIAGRLVATGVRGPDVTINVVEGQQRLRRLFDSKGQGEGGNLIKITVYAGVPFDLPFIEPVAVDRPLPEIRDEVRRKYAEQFGRQLDVTVNLQGRMAPAITITGEVRNPGRFDMPRPLTPFAAIAAAGGFLETSDPSRVAVVRFRENGEYSRWLFDLRNALANPASPQHEFILRYDDIVVVVKSDIADVNVWIDQHIRKMVPITIGAGIPITK